MPRPARYRGSAVQVTEINAYTACLPRHLERWSSRPQETHPRHNPDNRDRGNPGKGVTPWPPGKRTPPPRTGRTAPRTRPRPRRPPQPPAPQGRRQRAQASRHGQPGGPARAVARPRRRPSERAPGHRLHPAPDRPGPRPVLRCRRQRHGQAHRLRAGAADQRQTPPLPPSGPSRYLRPGRNHLTTPAAAGPEATGPWPAAACHPPGLCRKGRRMRASFTPASFHEHGTRPAG
jgi:hypothetical protein